MAQRTTNFVGMNFTDIKDIGNLIVSFRNLINSLQLELDKMYFIMDKLEIKVSLNGNKPDNVKPNSFWVDDRTDQKQLYFWNGNENRLIG